MPAILVLVAITQLTLAHTQSLTPWKGGGFGMFASMDQLDTRFARIELIDADGTIVSVAIDLYVGSADAHDLLERARAMPDRGALERLAADVAGIQWAEEDEVAVPAGDGPSDAPINVRGIRVSVWVYTFDRRQRALVPDELAELTVPHP